MSARNHSLQDAFLNGLRKSRCGITIFLVNGVKLTGIITWFDLYTILLKRGDDVQLVYKHAISTIMPVDKFSLHEPSIEEEVAE